MLTVRPRFLEIDPITTELSVLPAAKGAGANGGSCSHEGLELA